MSDEAFDAYQGQFVDREESDLTYRAYENSVDAMINLVSRDWTEPNTGLDSCLKLGGLKGQFCCTSRLGEMAMAIATDPENQYLFTGDTVGYIKIWDLYKWCNAAAVKDRPKAVKDREEKLHKCFLFLRYPYLTDKAADGFVNTTETHKRRPPRVTEPHMTLKTPRLLSVFRAHAQGITSVKYIPGHELILTASNDCSVRIWLIGGRFIGTCRDVWKDGLIDPRHACLWPNPIPLRKLPLDVRRTASLAIMQAGRAPRWEEAMKLVRMQLNAERMRKFAGSGDRRMIERWTFNARVREEAKKAAEAAEKKKAEKIQKKLKGLVVSDDEEDKQEMSTSREDASDEEGTSLEAVIKYDWEDPKKSTMLGKSFVPNMHYRPRPFYKQVLQDFGQEGINRKSQQQKKKGKRRKTVMKNKSNNLTYTTTNNREDNVTSNANDGSNNAEVNFTAVHETESKLESIFSGVKQNIRHKFDALGVCGTEFFTSVDPDAGSRLIGHARRKFSAIDRQ
nr:hypothetical protein BaRGS_015071 [Batillaria attramentaria]